MLSATSTLQNQTKTSTPLSERTIRDILGLARNCRLGQQQNALEVAAHLARVTADYHDFVFMREQIGTGGRYLYYDTAIRVVEACLVHRELGVAVGAMKAVQTDEHNSKVAGAWAQIYGMSKDFLHLGMARIIANRLPIDGAAIAFAQIFAQGCDQNDWEKCFDAAYHDGAGLPDYKWESRHAQETRASTAVVLAKSGLLQEAINLFATLTRPNPIIRAATAIGLESHEHCYLDSAMKQALITPELRLKVYRRIALLAATLEDNDILHSLRQMPWSQVCGNAGYCYASALCAVMAEPKHRAQILRETGAVAQQVSAYGESSLALTAYAWALARCGQLDAALRVAERLQENLQRCIAYLVIAKAHDLETAIEIGL